MAPSLTAEIKSSLNAIADGNRAIIETMKALGRPMGGVEGLLSHEARSGSGLRIGSDGAMEVIGKLWTKGIGMGKALETMHKAALLADQSKGAEAMAKLGWRKTALQETGGAIGGYTVLPEYSSKLLQLVFEDSVAAPYATIQPMDAKELSIPALDVTMRYSAGESPFLAGVVANWTEDAQPRAETEPQFRQVKLVNRELSGWTAASNTLLQDNAVGLDALLSQLFTMAISWYSDFAYIQGNGVGKPEGIRYAPATVFVTATTAGQVKFADVAGMYATLLPQSHKKAVWVISPTAIPYLLQLEDGEGNNIFIPRPTSPSGGGGAQAAPKWELLGRPVLITEKMPLMQTGSGVHQGVALIDWSLYLIGVRMEIDIAVSPHYRFIDNQSVWRFIARLDGRPWLDNSVRMQDGTTVLSPFVWLKNSG